MTELISAYKSQLIWGIGVITSVVLLVLITNFIYKRFIKKKKKSLPSESIRPIVAVKKLLNILWIILGLIALSFLFVDEENYGKIVEDFELVLYLGIIIISTIVTATITNLWFKKKVNKKLLLNQDPTTLKFLRYVFVFGIYFIGLILCLLAFPALRGIAQTALGGAGVLAIVVGIASQEALANVVGGVFIISFKPFKIGDIIKVSDTMVGTVVAITLRHTIIRNFENKMIVIPNSIINKEKLINYNLGDLKCCEHVEIGISYDSDVTLAKQIMREECEKHPLIYDNRSEEDIKASQPVVKTALIKINESTLNIRAWAWCKTFGDAFKLHCDVNETIKERFDAEGIDIAYPYRNIILKTEKDHPVDLTMKSQNPK
jgi:small-conductance mechanosensitive channel